MRTVAAWSLTKKLEDREEAQRAFARHQQATTDWLLNKGIQDVELAEQQIALTNGKQASFSHSRLRAEEGHIYAFSLLEPHDDTNEWETRFSLAVGDSELALFCQMRIGNRQAAVGNLRYDPRCPHFLREIITDGQWYAGPTAVSSSAASYLGGPQANELVKLIWNPNRKLPVVIVSESDGFTLHPDILDRLAYDLSGIAHVGLIDTDAAWRITQLRGKEWSCFWGAVRLYWPMSGQDANPRHHPFWAPSHVLKDGVDTKLAALRIRNSIRRRILTQSTALTQPGLISVLRAAHWGEIAKQAEESQENQALFELAASAEAQLREEVIQLKEDLEAATTENLHLERKNDELTAQLEQMNVAMAHAGRQSDASDTSDALQPNDIPQPTTVAEVVVQARRSCANLEFGGDVDEGVSGLAPSAGPPDEVLRYLQELNNMAALIVDDGEIGEHPHTWLEKRNVVSSGETKRTMSSRSEQQRRTWDTGFGDSDIYEFHLKVNESTNPANCVRIYYRLGEPGQRTSVGWVGRHP